MTENVVRSRAGICTFRSPAFPPCSGSWKDRMPVDLIRVFRPTWHRFEGHIGQKHAWYFVDNAGERVPCRSGYEALFATYLVSRSIPFEYEGLALVVTRKALYIPDFFLPSKGEFVELKGWTGGKTANQDKAIALLKKKGFVIRVLDWNALRIAIGSPYLHYKSFFDNAVANKQNVADFIAGARWLPKSIKVSKQAKKE